MQLRFIAYIVSLAGLITSGTRADSIYFIGNSVTDTINYNGFQAMAVAKGKTQPWGRQMIPGAPLQWLWEHPADGFNQPPYGYPGSALPNYAWNALSLQPFDRSLASDLQHTQLFLGQLFGSTSPNATQSANRLNTRILIYGRWPRQDDALRVGGPRDFDTLWLRDSSVSNECADFPQDLTVAVRGATVADVALANRVFMVPVGHVMYALNQQMKAGQLPGYTNIFQIYADGIHLNNIGSYLTACTYYATLYQESPVGLPVPSQYGTIDAALVTRIQETVWNVVQTETLSGVPSTGNLLFTTLSVPSAYKDQAYSTSLLAVGGVAPRTFAVSAGSLPGGMVLSGQGVLSGTPIQAGDFGFSVTASDATMPMALTASRNFTIRVEVDTSPVITTASTLPSLSRGGRYDLSLVATGGNGTLAWTLTAGSLPPGIQLGAGGILVGSALTQGNYAFTLQVSDSDTPSDTAAKSFTLAVAAPSPETLLVARTTSPIRIDGALTESHWNLTSSATRALMGTPDNSTAFSVLWDADKLYLAARVSDTRLVNGTGGERDCLEFFLDAFNDKQAEFNIQHRQFRVALDGLLFERGSRSNGVQQAVVLVPGGYQLEMSIPWTNLGIVPVADQTVIGLDLANGDADAATGRQHYQAFGFVDSNDPRPAQFGNAILTGTTVSGTGGEPLGISGPAPTAYEPFDYTVTPLHNVGGTPSFGFTGNWQVENTNSPGYAVEGQASLTFSQLGTTGRYMTGGNTYQTCGRSLDTVVSFLPWKRTSDSMIGKDGSTLWFSYLARPLKTNASMKFSLDDGGTVFHDNNGPLRIQQSGGVWRLALMNNTILAPSTVAVVANSTYFIVARLDFGATDTVTLYVNPALGSNPPVSASASATTTNANFRFNELQLNPGSAAGDGQFDELRFGTSWQSVIPVPSLPVAPVSFLPLPGSYATAPTITLGSVTAGAIIRYTTDGSVPTAASPVYTTPIILPSTSTIRAVAIKNGFTDAPVSGGSYVLQSAYDGWLDGRVWPQPAATSRLPGSDPDDDGSSNLLEYAFNTDPLISSSVPWTCRISDLKLEISYPRFRGEIDYLVEASPDLISWSSGGVTQDSVTPLGGIATASIPYNEITFPTRYLRVKVTMP